MWISLRPSRVRISVAAPLDVFDFRRAIASLASQHGFDTRACRTLELIATELGTNIVKHGVRGVARAEVHEHHTAGRMLSLEAEDEGPPIVDFEAAVADGWDGSGPLDPARMAGRKGIGRGLGAIQRLSDEFRYERMAEGNRFVVFVYQRAFGRQGFGRQL